MKTCLLCNTDAPDDAASCPNDGEASWSRVPGSEDAPVDGLAAGDVEPTNTPKARARRSRS